MASLVFNDTTVNKAGLIQECERRLFNSDYGRISGDSTMLADFTNRLNSGVDWVTDIIFKSDTRWQWDDTNKTTYPIYTETLVDNQHDYQLEVEHLKIHGVSIKNSDGDWVSLSPIDPSDIPVPLEEYFDTKGVPAYYDKLANSVFIYPAPDTTQVTASEGLKIYTQRSADYFTTASTTTAPGLPVLFHEAIADYASWSYAEDNDMDSRAERLARRLYGGGTIEGWKGKIEGFYSRRDVDDKPHLGVGASRNLNNLR